MPKQLAGRTDTFLSLYFAGNYKKQDMPILCAEEIQIVAYCNTYWFLAIANCCNFPPNYLFRLVI